MSEKPSTQGEGATPASEPASPPIDWDAAFRQHGRWLRTVIAARLGSRAAVEEVFQEVALAAVEQKAPLKDPDKVAPWLYRLAVLKSLLYRRKQGRRQKLLDRYALRNASPLGEGSETHDPLQWLLADERRGKVRQALAALPCRDAEMLLLKYTEDWSYHQIAEHLGVSHSAIESRLHRARKRMRDVLTQMNVAHVPT